MRFCKDQGPGAQILAEFIEDVATFRCGAAITSSAVLAKQIQADYVMPDSTGRSDDASPQHAPHRRRIANIVRHLPSYHSQPTSPRSDRGLNHEDSTMSETADGSSTSARSRPNPKWSQHMDLDLAKNAIKVVGQPVERLVARLADINPFDNKTNAVIKVPADTFDELDEIVFSYLRDAYFESFKHSSWWTKHFQFMSMTERTVLEEDFAIFRVLGRGGFGLVNACKRCTTGKLYAMKMLNKKRIKMKKAEALCLQERNIMALISSSYVVCLKYAFSTKDDLYLILDLMVGGDLGFHLSKRGRFSIKESRYYSARTLLGIAALHEKNIAYRDLKPENILMDEDGYTKISDLGLACKVGKSGLSGTCGTRGYWAPEMLRRDANDKRERYTVTVDWFSFGCLVYEFLYGISPFRTEKARQWGDFPKVEKADRDKAIDLAIQQMEPDFDDPVFDDDAKDLIRRLLHKDQKQRLGARGYREITNHPWFACTSPSPFANAFCHFFFLPSPHPVFRPFDWAAIDWENMAKSKPPMKPSKDINTATQSEIGTFADDKASRKIVLTEEDQKTYEKWEFISKRSFQEEIVDFYIYEELYGPIKVLNPTSGCCSIS
jgi:beta-adrenergic-receptor kinase